MPAYQTERKWIVTLKRSGGDDWPDIKRQFTRSSVFRPDTVIVTISRREGAEPRIEEVSAAVRRGSYQVRRRVPFLRARRHDGV